MTSWSEVRKEFPVTEHSVYLNTAAAGPLAISTQQAANEYYQLMMNDGDVHWDDWLARRETIRARVASFINDELDHRCVGASRRSYFKRFGVSRLNYSVDASTHPGAHRQVS